MLHESVLKCNRGCDEKISGANIASTYRQCSIAKIGAARRNHQERGMNVISHMYKVHQQLINSITVRMVDV